MGLPWNLVIKTKPIDRDRVHNFVRCDIDIFTKL
jgi:hypothetical protein